MTKETKAQKENWEEKFDNMFDLDGYGKSHIVQDKVKQFIRQACKKAEEAVKGEVREKIEGLKKTDFNIQYPTEKDFFNQALQDILDHLQSEGK